MSARREARASALATVRVPVDDVLTVLRDPDAPVWSDHDAFLSLMADHGWDPGCLGWMPDTHPHNRRNHAAEEWAVDHGMTLDDYPSQADRWALRRAGLAYDSEGTRAP